MSAARGTNPFETALGRTPANYTPLTPLTFIERAAAVYPDHPSVIDGERRFTWAETCARCHRLASALAGRGIGTGDCVAVFAPNVRAIYEASFAVPMLGAVLNTINIRLDAATVAFILEHGEAKVLLTDREFSPIIADALSRMRNPPLVIDIDDPLAAGGERIGEIEYEAFLGEGNPAFGGGEGTHWRRGPQRRAASARGGRAGRDRRAAAVHQPRRAAVRGGAVRAAPAAAAGAAVARRHLQPAPGAAIARRPGPAATSRRVLTVAARRRAAGCAMDVATAAP